MCMLLCTYLSPFFLLNESIGVVGAFSGLLTLTACGFTFVLFVLKETKGLTDEQCKALYLPKRLKF